jgi:hypothetical protein
LFTNRFLKEQERNERQEAARKEREQRNQQLLEVSPNSIFECKIIA